MEMSDIVNLILGLYAISCALGLGIYLCYVINESTKEEVDRKERLVKAIERISELYDK